ncbi:MAG TPA: MFS transporter, partial [Polyangiaceae bacterium]
MIRRPAAILALLTALNFLNYIDRYVLSTVLPLVEAELGLSNFVAGTLATVFLVGYFATSPFFGQLGDREGVPGGRKGLLAAGVGVWSLATFASGLASGAASLAGARAFVGIGEASYGTIAPTIIDDLAPPSKKGRWFSIFYLGITVGSALGFVIGGVVQKFVGWRATFFVVGGPGILAALLCLGMVEPARKGLAARPELLRSALRLAKIPLYRRSILGYCAATF